MSNKINPKVSAVMSVYNGEKYLREAIDSILQQTFADFEFIIINDGSTDRTRQILESYSDTRIRLFHQENIGLTKSLNRGLKLARAEYVARQDADDISYPNRFEKQLSFLDQNSHYSLVGTFADIITENNKFNRGLNFSAYSEILSNILFDNCFTHGSTMIRKSTLDHLGHYNEKLQFAQDYELNLRLVFHSKAKNIQDFLYAWRENYKSGISVARREEQRKLANTIRKQFIENRILSTGKHFQNLLANCKNYPRDQILWQMLNKFITKFNPNLTLKQKLDLELISFEHQKGESLASQRISPVLERISNISDKLGCINFADKTRYMALKYNPKNHFLLDRLIKCPLLSKVSLASLLPNRTCGISVLMPTYNRLHTIKESIQSVLNQSFRDFELIVVNDGGQDDVETIIQQFNSPKIRYFKIPHGGLSGALNKGLQESNGQYIAYLDDDDIYYPNHLQTLISAVLRTGRKFVYSRNYLSYGYFHGGKFTTVLRKPHHSQEVGKYTLVHGCYISTLNVLHHIDCIRAVGFFDENYTHSMDYDMWIRMAERFPFQFLNEITAEYRVHLENMSDRDRLWGAFYMTILKNYYENYHGKLILIESMLRLNPNQFASRINTIIKSLPKEPFMSLQQFIELVRLSSQAEGDMLIKYLSQNHLVSKPERLLIAFLITKQSAFLGKNWCDTFLRATFNITKHLIRGTLYYSKAAVTNPRYVLKMFQNLPPKISRHLLHKNRPI